MVNTTSFYVALLIISLVLFAVPIMAADVKESATGHLFSDSVSLISGFGKKKLDLAGVGVRVKQIGPINAKVYSVGVYVDKLLVSSKLKAASAAKRHKDAMSLLQSDDIQNAIVKTPSHKSIVLRMARSVGADTMCNALAESVSPRMSGGDCAALDQFKSILLESLKDGGAKNDMVFSFDSNADKCLRISVNGVLRGEVSSPDLCQAFASVYLDKNGVSSSLRENVARSLFSWN